VRGGGDRKAPAAPARPCTFLGLTVRRPGQVRDWRECDHPDRPLGNPVCPCRGCGPKCPGYKESADA